MEIPIPENLQAEMSTASMTGAALAEDWPQLQHDSQHTGYTPGRIHPSFKLAWFHSFHPERVSGFVQSVVYPGKVFVGTMMGNF